MNAAARLPLVAKFGHIDTWVFDLDNTLYPPVSDLWPQIDTRITQYLTALFGLAGLSARALQKYYYRRYGTTLCGLMAEHAIGSADLMDDREPQRLLFFRRSSSE